MKLVIGAERITAEQSGQNTEGLQKNTKKIQNMKKRYCKVRNFHVY